MSPQPSSFRHDPVELEANLIQVIPSPGPGVDTTVRLDFAERELARDHGLSGPIEGVLRTPRSVEFKFQNPRAQPVEIRVISPFVSNHNWTRGGTAALTLDRPLSAAEAAELVLQITIHR